MTNTTQPMTFEEWWQANTAPLLMGAFEVSLYKGTTKKTAELIWQASEANQQAEMDALKFDLDGYMKIAHASATEIVQQEKTIVKLVRALKEVISANPTIVFDKPEAFKYVSSIEKARQAIAEAESKS